MKLKKNDKVLVISGKDRGKVGRITRIIVKSSRLVVEGVNIRTKHIKKTQQQAGQKITFEAPISISNVMILDPSNNKPTRIGYKMLDNGKKERVSRLTGTSLDNVPLEASLKPKAKSAPKKKSAKSSTKKQVVKA